MINQLYSEKLGLENELNSSDYKVIKCAECLALGLDMPYDINLLHQQRQAARDRINEIQLIVSQLEEEMNNLPLVEEVEDFQETE